MNEKIDLDDIVSFLSGHNDPRESSWPFTISPGPAIFVEPTLIHKLDIDRYDDPQVMLISARGATGKSVFAQEISKRAQQPLWPLEADSAVSAASLERHLSKYTGKVNPYSDHDRLPNAIIIDSFDEARMRVSSTSWEEFIGTLIESAKKGVKLLLLGREQALEELWLYFYEEHVSVNWIEISHFSKQNRERYVDRKSDPSSRTPAYLEARDAIIRSLSESVDESENDGFVGYAPVLDAVAAVLRANSNYQKIKQEFETSTHRRSEELKNILMRILEREQEKVKVIAKEFDIDPQRAYTPDEQIVWLFHSLCHTDRPKIDYVDHNKREDYVERLDTFLQQHPFRTERKWASAVFSAYAASEVISNGRVDLDVNRIPSKDLIDIARQSGLLLSFTNTSSSEVFIDEISLAALHHSLLAEGNLKSVTSIRDADDNEDSYDVSFIGSDGDRGGASPYHLISGSNSHLLFGAPLEQVTINTKGAVTVESFGGDQILSVGPDVYINCQTLRFNCRSLDISRRTHSSAGATSDGVVFEIASSFVPGMEMQKNSSGLTDDDFEIRCPNYRELPYPWREFAQPLQEHEKSCDAQSPAVRFLNLLMNLTRSHGHKGLRGCYRMKLQGRQSFKGERFSRVVDELERMKIIQVDADMIYLCEDIEKHRFYGKQRGNEIVFEDVKGFWQPIADRITEVVSN